MDFSKPYNPSETEEKIYSQWEKSGFFNPDKLPLKKGKPFTVIMPPPNANGALHIGHALFVTLQDIIIRYHRMKGRKTLWLPGADHAGFETQVVYEKKLEKEGRSRFRMSPDDLYREIMAFTLANKGHMENQLRRLGASCDWSRKKFTLDKSIIEVVYDTFEKMKEDSLIYQGRRIANWCSKHQTSLSDLELKHEERQSPLYYVKYGPLTVATTRPETKFGDTALAVNPKDKRYSSYIGKSIKAGGLLGDFEINVISDNAVDPSFGTGVVKVTPAHDPLDFEIGLRHSLQSKQVIDFRGRLNEKTGPYSGMKVAEARLKVGDDLKANGLLEKIDETYRNTVALCYKCSSVIEPQVLDNQWFVRMTEKPKSGTLSLRDLAVKAVKDKKVRFIPGRFEKVFLHWMKNLRDWNISRQIVWGIPIPGEKDQVFDTWFSSGQWPFAALKTGQKNDFRTFYPTQVMETAADILFFWVARMIMLGVYATGKAPFSTVYLHGLVRDKDRQKMSKSKGNVIDPLGVIELYGADALRMALVVGNAPGHDPVIFEGKIVGYRNFANKIWNAARFVVDNTQDFKPGSRPTITPQDKKILLRLKKFSAEATELMEEMKFYAAAEKIYHYFWHTFCDTIIESQKERLKGKDLKEKRASQYLLVEILATTLKLLHPFMPFITEVVYQKITLKKKKMFLMVERWPA